MDILFFLRKVIIALLCVHWRRPRTSVHAVALRAACSCHATAMLAAHMMTIDTDQTRKLSRCGGHAMISNF
jgi:hypothetical protein